MTDYRPLLTRAIANLDPNTGEGRRAVYDRARTALVNQLRGLDPPLAEADITRERLALEDAIRKVESEAAAGGSATRAPVAPAAPATPAPAPTAPAQARPERPERSSRPLPPQAPPPRSPLPRNPPPPRAQDLSRDLPPEEFDENDMPVAQDPQPMRNGRPAAREAAPQRGAPSLRPRGRGRSPADYAREEARRASRTKFVVFGIILLLLLLAAAVGYINRDRIFSLVSGRIPLGVEQSDTKTQTAPKANDRLPQNQQQQTPGPLAQAPIGAGNRAVLFEENPGTQQFTTINGTVSWRAETISPGENRPPELMVHADIEVPDRKLKVSFSMRRNPEASSSASHYVYVRFSGDDSFGGIAQVPFLRMKPNESAQGAPLVAIAHRVMPGFFLLGLSAIDADRERNFAALKSQPWIDIAFVYENGRRSVIAFEKGPAGEKVLADAFAAWGM